MADYTTGATSVTATTATDTTTDARPHDPTTVQKLAAEAIGVFTLVLVGCGSATFVANLYNRALLSFDGADRSTAIDQLTVSQAFARTGTVGLAFGLTIVVLVYAFGRISGGHFNPAVSVGAAISGRFAWSQVPLYVAAQVAGAIVGAAVLFGLLHGIDGFDATNSMGQNGFGDDGGGYAWWAAFLLELVLTAIFVMVILAVTDTRNEHPALAPLAIGLTLAVIHFVAIPATGTSVNPARSIGPALFAGGDAIKDLWLFILAPLAGGALAGVVYAMVFGHGSDPVPGSGLARGRTAHAGAVPGYGATDQFQQEWNRQAPAAAQPVAAQPVVAQPVVAQPVVAQPDALQQEWNPAVAEPVAQAAAQDRPPIIQDGWQWDYDAQEWKPAAVAPAPTSDPGAGTTGWPATPDDGRTQIRPGDGQ